MLTTGSVLLDIVVRTAIIYSAVLVGMRISGKRQVGQMTPFDLVLLLLIANAVQNAMTGPDTSLVGGLAAAATLLVLNTVISRLALRNKRVHSIVEGNPTLLVHSGKIIKSHLDREKIGEQELQQALREHGIASVEDVQGAVLEVDGSISVIKKDEMPKTPQLHHRIRFLQRRPG
ncbi:MAG TPA: DUF421 domain-containing protein [Bacteroidetes bacterium]|nr:DUF421 domain-containing protein [Bacteroidota bacterium]